MILKSVATRWVGSIPGRSKRFVVDSVHTVPDTHTNPHIVGDTKSDSLSRSVRKLGCRSVSKPAGVRKSFVSQSTSEISLAGDNMLQIMAVTLENPDRDVM
jgi:hypothetical protein